MPEKIENGIEIRLASADDAAQVACVLLEAFVEYKSSYTADGFAATTLNKELVVERLKEGPVWVAIYQKRIAGTASAVLREDSVYVRGMAVVPASQGLRIGARLLDQIERFAHQHDSKRLILSTTPFLSRAIRLYEQSGFRRTTEGPHNLFGTPLFSMQKILSDSDPQGSH